MDSPTGDPLVGTTVAQYDVLAKLGGGGMGIVYAARDTRLGRRVALKFLPPQWSHDESAKQRFTREAQAASATDHPNICTIHDIATAPDGRLFIVMAHYDGPTLKQKLEAGPLPIDEALDVAAQVAEGLHKAHMQGVVHRDIKPGNLILAEDGIRIVDFGLARFAGSLQLTMEGSTLGTVAYMSPEQTRGDDADARSDVWSVGVVFYEMLTGELPFKGAYAEAISHAIKNDAVPVLRLPKEHHEPLARIVRRALEKDPAQRYQSARELARDLRLLQGRTLPLDLRTERLPPLPGLKEQRQRPWWKSPTGLSTAVVLAVLVSTAVWIFTPIERVPVVVAPVVNQTGYAQLDPYRMALTEELVAELAASPSIRVLPYDRLVQIVRRFRRGGLDVSSREAIQALTANSDARVVIVPTLLYENGAWRGRLEFRNTATATNEAAVDTASVVSSLMNDTAYGLIPSLAGAIEARFVAIGPRRGLVAASLRRLAGFAPVPPGIRLRTLDAAAALEQGRDAYEQLEYAMALRAFTAASERDPRSPLPLAWRSRVAGLMRRDAEAADAADRASRLPADNLPETDRLFISAAVAEGQDAAGAEGRYQELAEGHLDDPAGAAELAAYFDRRNRNEEAVAGFLATLRLDPRLPRPELDLCRLYNRLSEPSQAQEHGTRALSMYRSLGAANGQAQALLCLADALRTGTAEQRRLARDHAQAALTLFGDQQAVYNVPRAYNYLAMIAGIQGSRAEAAAFGERALTTAREAGNQVLQPLVLMNLGVTHEALGNRARAATYYEESYKLYEAMGDQARAAENQANRGALLIEFGPNPEEGLREVQNALVVSRARGNKDFEAFCLQRIASYYQYAGRHAEAERILNQALAIARERNLAEKVATVTIRLVRSRLALGDYGGAHDLLMQGVPSGADASNRMEANIQLGRVFVRLGDFDAARAQLSNATADLQGGDRFLLPLLHEASGELAFESGRMDEARAEFAEASSLWVDDRPAGASVEARAYLGLLDALAGRTAEGRRTVRVSLDHARRLGRVSLEALCRLFLARIDIAERKFTDALTSLRDVPTDTADQTIGAELRAQLQYWQAFAEAALDRPDGPAGAQAARSRLAALRASLPEKYRATFARRREIARILG